MKKYLIQFACLDGPTMDDDGVEAGLNFDLIEEEGKVKLFGSREEAENYIQTTLIPEERADLEDSYGITEEPELADDYEFSIERDRRERPELVVYSYGEIIYSVIYSVKEIEF